MATVEVGISAIRFKYEEYSNIDGSVLDTEQGGVPGVSLKLGWYPAKWKLETIASYHQGQVDYTGQTNLGVPYNTRTDEKIGDVAVRVGRSLNEHFPVTPYFGLGYRRWDRDILPGTVGGLFESYRWTYIWLGTQVQWSDSKSSKHIFDIGLIRPLDPSLTIDFRGAYNSSPLVYPVAQNGLRLLSTSSFKIHTNIQLTFEPYFEYWGLGQSPVATSNGVSVYEPSSKTGNFGVNLRLGRVF